MAAAPHIPAGLRPSDPCTHCSHPLGSGADMVTLLSPRPDGDVPIFLGVHPHCYDIAAAAIERVNRYDLTHTPEDVQQLLLGLPMQLQLQRDDLRACEVEALERWFTES